MPSQTATSTGDILASDPEDFILIGYVDLDGVIRGKYTTASKFASWRDNGGTFCSVVLGWDSRDELYDNSHTGWATGYHDDPIRIVPGEGRLMPGEGAAVSSDGICRWPWG